MKNLKIGIVAILLFALLAGIASAAIPAPPVNQNMGLPDTKMIDVPVTLCKGCHPGAPDIHHYMVSGTTKTNNLPTTNLGCLDCHPIVGGLLTISRNCHDCHDGTAWTVNPNINLATIRGAPGRPHHNITKNSASSTFNAAYWAADRHCTNCHSNGYLDNYDDGHAVPTYNTSIITPMASFKVNASGKLWGGCLACHDDGVEGTQVVYNSDSTHHTARFWVGYQCNNCHVSFGFRAEPTIDYNPEPNAAALRIWYGIAYPQYTQMFGWDNTTRHMEFRNNTIMSTGDLLNGTGCEKCHSVRDLHNIETGAPELGLDQAQVIAAELPGYGHIGNNSDCNGCHQGWTGATTNPFPGPKAMVINSITPGVLTADVAADITITGDGFVEDPYTTTLLIDDQPVQASITATQIVASVNLATGVHSVVVKKDIATTPLTTVIAVAPGTIASATLEGTTLTIDGAGLGADQTTVVILKSDGTRKASDSVTSSTNTQIVAVASQAAVGDTLEVVTPTGLATATIEAGATPTPTPTPTPTAGITVTSPNGGESWNRGTTHTITWDKVGDMGANVKIELLKGTSASTIKSSTANSGSYSWTISSKQSLANNYKIRITTINTRRQTYPIYTDMSDNTFTIVK
jgi:hypothetical protein